jgi:hypothetical protein
MNYKAKAKDSFRTKFNIYLFKHVLLPESAPMDFEIFRGYEIEEELVRQHTTQYWQQHSDFEIAGQRIKDIESSIVKFKDENKTLIKDWEARYVREVFPSQFREQEFQRISGEEKCASSSPLTRSIS